MARAKAAAAPRRSWLWLQGAVCGGLVVMVPGTALLLGTLLALGLAMLVFETSKGRPVARSMLLMGGATSLLPLQQLWSHGGSVGAAMDILSDPLVPLWSWAASGSSWLVEQVWEVVSIYILQTADDHAAKRLREERAELQKEWEGIG